MRYAIGGHAVCDAIVLHVRTDGVGYYWGGYKYLGSGDETGGGLHFPQTLGDTYIIRLPSVTGS